LERLNNPIYAAQIDARLDVTGKASKLIHQAESYGSPLFVFVERRE
jgi:hypothetical protein